MGITENNVDWGALKSKLGNDYAKSPLPALEAESCLKNICQLVTLDGFEMLINSDTELDCIYLVIDGMIGIGNKSNISPNYFVQNLIVKPYSFIGEIEAPMDTNKYKFTQLSPSQSAWVSSQELSFLMAFHTGSIQCTIPFNTSTNFHFKILDYFLNNNILQNDDIEVQPNEYFCGGRGISKLKDQLESESIPVPITLPSEVDVFARKAEAVLLKIPFVDGNANILWNNEQLKKLLCEDSFLRSKQYWMKSQDCTLEKIVSDLYRYANLNDLVVDKVLYLLDKDRFQAITERSHILRGLAHKRFASKLERLGLRVETTSHKQSTMLMSQLAELLKPTISLQAKALNHAFCLNALRKKGGLTKSFKISVISDT